MKILIIRFSSIGDIVLTTPVIRCIKEQVRHVEIHYLTKKQFSDVLEHNPYIDKLYTIRKNTSEVENNLKKENYDFIVDLHHNLRSAQIKSILRKKFKSFRKLNLEKWLMVKFKINRLPPIHITDRYFETVGFLKIKNDGKGLDYFIPKKDEVNIRELPTSFQNGYVGFVIGAKHFTKQLPAEKIAAICKKINFPIILLGGKEDTEKADKIISMLDGKKSEFIFNACGKYNLNQSASLVKQAQKIITHDTGLMHVASAFKKEMVSVWGSTIPAFGMYPYYGKSEVRNLKSEVQKLSCRPCSKIGYAKCPKGHFKCMNKIDEDEIIKFIHS